MGHPHRRAVGRFRGNEDVGRIVGARGQAGHRHRAGQHQGTAHGQRPALRRDGQPVGGARAVDYGIGEGHRQFAGVGHGQGLRGRQVGAAPGPRIHYPVGRQRQHRAARIGHGKGVGHGCGGQVVGVARLRGCNADAARTGEGQLAAGQLGRAGRHRKLHRQAGTGRRAQIDRAGARLVGQRREGDRLCGWGNHQGVGGAAVIIGVRDGRDDRVAAGIGRRGRVAAIGYGRRQVRRLRADGDWLAGAVIGLAERAQKHGGLGRIYHDTGRTTHRGIACRVGGCEGHTLQGSAAAWNDVRGGEGKGSAHRGGPTAEDRTGQGLAVGYGRGGRPVGNSGGGGVDRQADTLGGTAQKTGDHRGIGPRIGTSSRGHRVAGVGGAGDVGATQLPLVGEGTVAIGDNEAESKRLSRGNGFVGQAGNLGSSRGHGQ